MSETWKKRLHLALQSLPILGVLILATFVVYGLHLGIFRTTHTLQAFIDGFGQYGILLFIGIQIIQVILPILPGGISTVVGMLMFGPFYGLIYSYIGLVLGEILAYFMVRHYGRGLVRMILSEKSYEKFDALIVKSHKNLRKLLIITFLIPFAPDDIACFVAGLANMRFRDYLTIVLLLKPISIGVYSFILLYVLSQFIH